MVDAHVHLEKGNYCIEWVQEFIQYARSRNIDELYFLEHTHIKSAPAYMMKWHLTTNTKITGIEKSMKMLGRLRIT